ncbi:MAG: anti-sigma factor domain-containing protein [Pyrinomonadaceae bacterium]
MTHEEYKDLLALEALHSLDKAEASLLHEHLATCDECHSELIEWRDAAALLAPSVDQVAPPETLRARILDSIKETNAFSHAPTNGEANADLETRSSKETGKVLPLRKKNDAGVDKAFVGKSAWWSGALAASLLVGALIVSLVVFWQRNNAQQQEQARLSSRNDDKQAESNQSPPRNDATQTERAPLPNSNDDNEAPPQINRSSNRDLPNRNDGANRQDKKTVERKANAPAANRRPQIAEPPVTSEPDASAAATRIVQLAGTEKAPQAHARMVFDKSTGNMTVTVSDLPPPAAGRAYQLWFIVKGHPIPGSVFVTGQEGRAMLRGQIPAGARDATAFAVTLEKSNGANKPSGAKYLLGSINAS